MENQVNTLILGAGAAGLFCGIQAAGNGNSVLVLDHAAKPGEKIRISGGGRCNFTNMNCSAENFYSSNSHFAKSALARFDQHDFVELVDRYNINWHEKSLGQLFCDGSSKQIIEMLLSELYQAGGKLALSTTIENVEKSETGFQIKTSNGAVECENLVIATGGKSIPKMGASGFGYQIAEQFGLSVLETRPALVPLTFNQDLLSITSPLSGIGIDCEVSCNGTSFREALLFTHRGLSGPAILQISAAWREGDEISTNLLPSHTVSEILSDARKHNGRKSVKSVLSEFLPARVAEFACQYLTIDGNIADQSSKRLEQLSDFLGAWTLNPAGSEGYRTAEVTLGGVSTNELSGKNMQSKTVPGLFFIGEVVDVTGWLGGYNFQWAWSSAYVAGQHIAQS